MSSDPSGPASAATSRRGTATSCLPFPPLATPDFAMRTNWDVAAMLGYLDTWSAVRRCRARTGRDPLAVIAAPLTAAWGAGSREMRWPLTLRAGRA